MTARDVTIGARELNDTLPWHFLLDSGMHILSVGPVLAGFVGVVDGCRIDEVFAAQRPSGELSQLAFGATDGKCFMLQSLAEPRLVLRGQLVRTCDGELLFFGGPSASPEVLGALGLTIQDFAAHDPIGDCLVLLHAQQASLADAACFAKDLEMLNGSLEELVRERTSKLVTTLDALREAQAGLEREKAERERVEGELRLAHRLEAVGQLAAGVAHEINTPVQYVGDSVQFLHDAYVELAQLDPGYTLAIAALRAAGDAATATSLVERRESLDTDFLFAQVPRAFERAFDGLRQVAGIVRAMKAFAHPGEATRGSADINQALANTLAVARNEYKYVADVETTFGDLPRIPCYVAELNQVFLNLVVNAAHAVGDVVGGTTRRGHIRIQTKTEGAYAVVEISDDGIGIPESLKERIFDPFFTTKPVGKGTGQGLTIARSIVTKHQGRMEVRSKSGEGTTFRVLLPLEAEAAACLQ